MLFLFAFSNFMQLPQGRSGNFVLSTILRSNVSYAACRERKDFFPARHKWLWKPLPSIILFLAHQKELSQRKTVLTSPQRKHSATPVSDQSFFRLCLWHACRRKVLPSGKPVLDIFRQHNARKIESRPFIAWNAPFAKCAVPYGRASNYTRTGYYIHKSEVILKWLSAVALHITHMFDTEVSVLCASVSPRIYSELIVQAFSTTFCSEYVAAWYRISNGK